MSPWCPLDPPEINIWIHHWFQWVNSKIPAYIRSILPQTRLTDTGRVLRNFGAQTLPLNRTSAFQQSFVPATTKLWNKIPTSTKNKPFPAFKREISKQLGTPAPPKFYSLGTRPGNKLHTSLRLGVSKLNSHLFKFQLIDSTKCECSYHNETTEHFILNCPLYTNLRISLFSRLSDALFLDFNALSKANQIETLIHGSGLNTDQQKIVAYEFQKYLLRSGRFNDLHT